jgi:hypothetical protein
LIRLVLTQRPSASLGNLGQRLANVGSKCEANLASSTDELPQSANPLQTGKFAKSSLSGSDFRTHYEPTRRIGPLKPEI